MRRCPYCGAWLDPCEPCDCGKQDPDKVGAEIAHGARQHKGFEHQYLVGAVIGTLDGPYTDREVVAILRAAMKEWKVLTDGCPRDPL